MQEGGVVQGRREHDEVCRDEREHVTGGGTTHAHADRQGARQGGVGGGWTRTTRREGAREINRVASPPSSKSEAESYYCLSYLS